MPWNQFSAWNPNEARIQTANPNWPFSLSLLNTPDHSYKYYYQKGKRSWKTYPQQNRPLCLSNWIQAGWAKLPIRWNHSRFLSEEIKRSSLTLVSGQYWFWPRSIGLLTCHENQFSPADPPHFFTRLSASSACKFSFYFTVQHNV